ncbi:hypothetical protein PT276_02370 [Orbaceae bacterium ESL0721]|nr:hypothetical protein [Orbaceae bacterium ESL0721]
MKRQTPNAKRQTPNAKRQTPNASNILNFFYSLLTYSPSIIVPLFIPIFPAIAALTAVTNQTVMGDEPYFTFDQGKTKVERAEELLDITLSDGRSFNKTNNPSTVEKPIILPVEKQSFADITSFIPKTLGSINLNDLVHEPYNYWGDDNGDGQDGITATGNISMKISDVFGQAVDRASIPSLCNQPYKVTISASGTLTTQYGNPRVKELGSATVDYYIKPKTGSPVACFAQPNLDYSSTHKHSRQGLGPWASFVDVDGPASQWMPDRGFRLQSLTNPSANFPTMGAHGLFFNLILTDGLGKNVTYSKSPASSPVNLVITDAGSNMAKVKLTGPRNGATPEYAQSFTPTTFILYSDSSKSNAIYSFTISKWFIAKPGRATSGWDNSYCQNTYGSRYRTPKIVEYTNANEPNKGWTGGLAGQSTTYQRRIGGGLFSEWGNMDNSGDQSDKSIYQESDFDVVSYWAAESYDANNKYYADSYGGWVNYADSMFEWYANACVTP